MFRAFYFRLEIMFHVSCYLPLQEHDTQRVERKRHLGNDIVVIVFLEKDANVGFSPLSIKSHFIHTYVVVQVDHCEGPDIYYRVCVVSDETVCEVCCEGLSLPVSQLVSLSARKCLIIDSIVMFFVFCCEVFCSYLVASSRVCLAHQRCSLSALLLLACVHQPHLGFRRIYVSV